MLLPTKQTDRVVNSKIKHTNFPKGRSSDRPLFFNKISKIVNYSKQINPFLAPLPSNFAHSANFTCPTNFTHSVNLPCLANFTHSENSTFLTNFTHLVNLPSSACMRDVLNGQITHRDKSLAGFSIYACGVRYVLTHSICFCIPRQRRDMSKFLAKGEICQKREGFISYRIGAKRQYIELERLGFPEAKNELWGFAA